MLGTRPEPHAYAELNRALNVQICIVCSDHLPFERSSFIILQWRRWAQDQNLIYQIWSKTARSWIEIFECHACISILCHQWEYQQCCLITFVTAGTTVLCDEVVDKTVVLRMNKNFMKCMNLNYPWILKQRSWFPTYCHLRRWQRARWCRDGLRIDIYMYLCIHDILYIHEIHVVPRGSKWAS